MNPKTNPVIAFTCGTHPVAYGAYEVHPRYSSTISVVGHDPAQPVVPALTIKTKDLDHVLAIHKVLDACYRDSMICGAGLRNMSGRKLGNFSAIWNTLSMRDPNTGRFPKYERVGDELAEAWAAYKGSTVRLARSSDGWWIHQTSFDLDELLAWLGTKSMGAAVTEDTKQSLVLTDNPQIRAIIINRRADFDFASTSFLIDAV